MPDPMPAPVATDPQHVAVRLAHWVSALVVSAVLVLAFTHEMPESSATSRTMLGWHQRLGLAVALLLLVRLLVRLRAYRPAVAAGLPRLLRAGAALSHALLYGLLALIPMLGWAMTSARGRDVSLLPGGSALPRLVATDPDLSDTLQTFHERAAWVLIALVVMHAAAALWHHFVRRDGVLAAMWPGLTRRGSDNPDPGARPGER